MERIQHFWLEQTSAEYASSAITVQYIHWLQRVGASPELIKQGLRIADDEMNHAELAYAIAVKAGTTLAPEINDAALCPAITCEPLHKAVFQRNLRFYCLGETLAIPLFRAMREHSQQADVIAAYHQILKDEGRHSNYGWLGLAWMIENWDEAPQWLAELLPRLLQELTQQYTADDEYQPELSAEERAWGMLPKAEYGRILQHTIQHTYAKKFADYEEYLLLDKNSICTLFA
jgi:hypothetical protein